MDISIILLTYLFAVIKSVLDRFYHNPCQVDDKNQYSMNLQLFNAGNCFLKLLVCFTLLVISTISFAATNCCISDKNNDCNIKEKCSHKCLTIIERTSNFPLLTSPETCSSHTIGNSTTASSAMKGIKASKTVINDITINVYNTLLNQKIRLRLLNIF